MSAGPGVSVAETAETCPGCKDPTLVRVYGRVGHWGCLERRGELGAPPAPAASPPLKLRLYRDLETTCAPKRMHGGKLASPFWRPPLPGAIDLVQTSGWGWSRPYGGPVVVLDRNGAYLAAAASVEVAHGALEEQPEGLFDGLPGIYQMPVYPWLEDGLPHPLGGLADVAYDNNGKFVEGKTVWVTHERGKLLDQLARQDRYPQVAHLGAWTCRTDPAGKAEKVRLTKWTDHVQAVRTSILDQYGPESDEYRKTFKNNFGQAVTMMIGRRQPGQGRTWQGGIHRPDWGWAIQDLSAVTLWRWADDCTRVVTAAGRPDLAPVAMRAVDELVVPADALDIITTTPRSATRGPLVIDQTGVTLGAFKIKGTE